MERGLQEGFSDALVIKEAVEQGWIKISQLNKKDTVLCQKIIEHAFEIHLGEAQAIVLARTMDALLLIDESSGRAFAEAWGLKAKGTLHVILRALSSGLLDKAQAKETVQNLVSKGFRIEPNLLARTLKEIENYKK